MLNRERVLRAFAVVVVLAALACVVWADGLAIGGMCLGVAAAVGSGSRGQDAKREPLWRCACGWRGQLAPHCIAGCVHCERCDTALTGKQPRCALVPLDLSAIQDRRRKFAGRLAATVLRLPPKLTFGRALVKAVDRHALEGSVSIHWLADDALVDMLEEYVGQGDRGERGRTRALIDRMEHGSNEEALASNEEALAAAEELVRDEACEHVEPGCTAGPEANDGRVPSPASAATPATQPAGPSGAGPRDGGSDAGASDGSVPARDPRGVAAAEGPLVTACDLWDAMEQANAEVDGEGWLESFEDAEDASIYERAAELLWARLRPRVEQIASERDGALRALEISEALRKEAREARDAALRDLGSREAELQADIREATAAADRACDGRDAARAEAERLREKLAGRERLLDAAEAGLAKLEELTRDHEGPWGPEVMALRSAIAEAETSA